MRVEHAAAAAAAVATELSLECIHCERCCATVTTTVAPPGFCNRGEVKYWSIGGLEYEVPESRLYCLCINVALCTTALQCICRVIRRSSMTMKAHTYYIIFGRPPMGGSFPSWWRHCSEMCRVSKSHLNNDVTNLSVKQYNHHR